MATVQVTNVLGQPSYLGQSVRVSVAQSENSKLLQLAVGMSCVQDDSSNVGYIESVDSYGTSFLVTPQYPTTTFESTPGILQSTKTVTITI